MRRLLYLLPFGLLGVACIPPGDPLGPYRGPIPVPIPHVDPVEVCQHFVVPGYRFQFVVPQRGVWSFDWRDTQGAWHSNTTPFWYEPGATYLVETPFPFHVTWTPSATPGTSWSVVSGDITPVPAALCPDY